MRFTQPIRRGTIRQQHTLGRWGRRNLGHGRMASLGGLELHTDGAQALVGDNVTVEVVANTVVRVKASSSSDRQILVSENASRAAWQAYPFNASGGWQVAEYFSAPAEIQAGDRIIFTDSSSGDYAISGPLAADFVGRAFTVINIGTANTVTVNRQGGDTYTITGELEFTVTSGQSRTWTAREGVFYEI